MIVRRGSSIPCGRAGGKSPFAMLLLLLLLRVLNEIGEFLCERLFLDSICCCRRQSRRLFFHNLQLAILALEVEPRVFSKVL